MTVAACAPQKMYQLRADTSRKAGLPGVDNSAGGPHPDQLAHTESAHATQLAEEDLLQHGHLHVSQQAFCTQTSVSVKESQCRKSSPAAITMDCLAADSLLQSGGLLVPSG